MSNHPFFFPQWLATDQWENITSSVGDTFDIDYFPLLEGTRGGYFGTVERLSEAGVTHGGKNTLLHHYRFIFWAGKNKSRAGGQYDVYTDGKRLVAALGSDGVKILRHNWEDATVNLKSPLPPITNP